MPSSKKLPVPARLPMPAHMQADFQKNRYVPSHIKHSEYIEALYAKAEAKRDTPEARQQERESRAQRFAPVEAEDDTPMIAKRPPTARELAEKHGTLPACNVAAPPQRTSGSFLKSAAPALDASLDQPSTRMAPKAERPDKPKSPKVITPKKLAGMPKTAAYNVASSGFAVEALATRPKQPLIILAKTPSKNGPPPPPPGPPPTSSLPQHHELVSKMRSDGSVKEPLGPPASLPPPAQLAAPSTATTPTLPWWARCLPGATARCFEPAVSAAAPTAPPAKPAPIATPAPAAPTPDVVAVAPPSAATKPFKFEPVAIKPPAAKPHNAKPALAAAAATSVAASSGGAEKVAAAAAGAASKLSSDAKLIGAGSKASRGSVAASAAPVPGTTASALATTAAAADPPAPLPLSAVLGKAASAAAAPGATVTPTEATATGAPAPAAANSRSEGVAGAGARLPGLRVDTPANGSSDSTTAVDAGACNPPAVIAATTAAAKDGTASPPLPLKGAYKPFQRRPDAPMEKPATKVEDCAAAFGGTAAAAALQPAAPGNLFDWFSGDARGRGVPPGISLVGLVATGLRDSAETPDTSDAAVTKPPNAASAEPGAYANYVRARAPLHERGRMPAPPPTRAPTFAGDYGQAPSIAKKAKSKTAASPFHTPANQPAKASSVPNSRAASPGRPGSRAASPTPSRGLSGASSAREKKRTGAAEELPTTARHEDEPGAFVIQYREDRRNGPQICAGWK